MKGLGGKRIRTVALNVRISSVSGRAQALDGVWPSVAVGVLPAQRGRTVGFLLHSATVVRVPSCARIAHTLRLLQRVLAMGVGAAGGIAGGWLNSCWKGINSIYVRRTK